MASKGFLESKWRANARRLQLEFSSAPHAFFLTGRRGDLPVSITVDHGSNEALLEVEVRRTPGLDMRLVREGVGAKFSKLTGAQDIQIGDPTFDPVFLIQGMEPGAVKEFLTPERKNVLLRLIESHPSAEITHGSVNVTQKADIDATQVEKILVALCKAATILNARADVVHRSTALEATPEPESPQTQEDPRRAQFYDLLSRGLSPFDPVLIAGLLHRLGPMITEVSAEQFAGLMGSNLAEYGTVRAEQFEPTEFARIDGVAAVFTHNDLSKSANDTGGATLWLQMSWPRGLALLLERADGEVIIDHGSPHALRLSTDQVSRLLAVFNGKALAAADSLCVVIGQNGSVFGTLDQNRKKSVLVYDSEADATAVLGELRNQAGQQLTLKSLPILTALSELIRGPHEQVVANHGLRTARVYTKDDLGELLEVAKRLRLQSDKSSPIFRGARARERAAWQAPTTDPSQLNAVLDELLEDVEQDRSPWWHRAERVAYDMGFWVTVHPQVLEGLTWPAMKPQSDPSKSYTLIYTARDLAKDFFVARPDWQHPRWMSGLEMLRWVWATPIAVDLVVVNYNPGSMRALNLPALWAVPNLFPLSTPLESLDAVSPLTEEECAAWRARPVLHPRVVRTLLQREPDRNWGADVERAANGATVAAGEWSLDAADCAGLQLWKQGGGRRPSASQYIDYLRTLRGRVSEATLGEMATAPYEYFLLLGEGNTMAQSPLENRLVAFSSKSRADAWCATFEAVEAFGTKVVARPVPSRWLINVFDMAQTRSQGLVIDPPAGEAGHPMAMMQALMPSDGDLGLRLGSQGLEAATERLDALLTPRVEGFVHASEPV